MTAPKSLLVGHRPNNVADAFVDLFMLDPILNRTRLLYIPDKDTLDVTHEDLIVKYLDQHGPFDEIIYCAAVNTLAWLKDIKMEDIEEVFRVNYFGWVSLIGAHEDLYPHRLKRAVAVVSDASKVPMRGSLMYNSSKAALAFSIRNMARELAPYTTVVGVSPTVIDDTPMTDYIDEAVPKFRGWDPEQARAYEKSNIPIGRRVTKQEVAEVMMFALNGPEALTGSIIDITGGK